MTGALVILAALIVIGLLLYITDKTYFSHGHHSQERRDGEIAVEKIGDKNPDGGKSHAEFCCGLHAVCEKTGLSPVGDDIIYYDDEELDRFAGREPDSYSEEEKEEFRDVMLTLIPEDVAGWARSIALRKIEIPPEVREELLMIVSELRSAT